MNSLEGHGLYTVYVTMPVNDDPEERKWAEIAQVEMEHLGYYEECFDNLPERPLEPDKVQEARRDEVQFIKQLESMRRYHSHSATQEPEPSQ